MNRMTSKEWAEISRRLVEHWAKRLVKQGLAAEVDEHGTRVMVRGEHGACVVLHLDIGRGEIVRALEVSSFHIGGYARRSARISKLDPVHVASKVRERLSAEMRAGLRVEQRRSRAKGIEEHRISLRRELGIEQIAAYTRVGELRYSLNELTEAELRAAAKAVRDMREGGGA